MLEEPLPLRSLQEKAQRHASFLFDVSAALARPQSPRGLSAAVASAAAGVFCDGCVVHLKEESQPVIRLDVARDTGEGEAALEKTFEGAFSEGGFLHEAMCSAEALHLRPDAPPESFIQEATARALQASGMESTIVAPLSIECNGVGAMAFLNRKSVAFDEADVRCAVAVARQLAIAIENALLRERERRAVARADLLGDATDRLFSTSNEFEMLSRLVDVIVEQFADWASAATVSGDTLIPIATACAQAETAEMQRWRTEQLFGAERGRIVAAIGEQLPLLSGGQPSWMMAPLLVGGREYGAVFCHSHSRAYDNDDLEALRELCRRTSLALEYAYSFARERRLAQTLQRATLPPNLPHVPGAAASVVYQPAAQEEQVGGDWYDLFPLGEGRILATIGDVTGHGLPAWSIMSKLRHSINAIAKYEANPARILDVVEEVVLQRYPEAIATAFAAILDTRRQTITYANAGHPAPIVRRRDGTVEALRTYGLPIGLRQSGPAGDLQTASLQGAALLVFYTDGLIESTRNAVDGERWLVRSLYSDTAYLTADSANFVKSYCLRGLVRDDVAILTLNFVSLPRWSFASSDQQAAQKARDEFCDLLLAGRMASDDCAASELIFGELLGNVARHAPGPLEAALEFREDRAILHVIDRGPGYRVARPLRAQCSRRRRPRLVARSAVRNLARGGAYPWVRNAYGCDVARQDLRRLDNRTDELAGAHDNDLARDAS